MPTKTNVYHNLEYKKELGQHILINPGVIDTIIAKAEIRPSDTCFEIGPGTGNLTIKLLKHCKKVVAFEKDKRLASELLRRVTTAGLRDKLELVTCDALKQPFPFFDLCISNIPYNISSPLVFRLLQHDRPWRSAFLMVQREYALRLVAHPNESAYSRLSASVQLLAYAEHVLKVSRKSYKPVPKVDSSVVRLAPKSCSVSFREANELFKIVFSRKNKTISAIFKKKSTLKDLEKRYTECCGRRGVKAERPMAELVQGFIDGMEDRRPVKMRTEEYFTILERMRAAGLFLEECATVDTDFE